MYWRGDRTQEEVAALLRGMGVPCSRAQYAHIELGRRNPNPETAQALASIFEVSMEEIYFGPQPAKKEA